MERKITKKKTDKSVSSLPTNILADELAKRERMKSFLSEEYVLWRPNKLLNDIKTLLNKRSIDPWVAAAIRELNTLKIKD